MGEWNYIWAAYSVTWVALAAYAVYVTRRARRAAEAGRALNRKVGENA